MTVKVFYVSRGFVCTSVHSSLVNAVCSIHGSTVFAVCDVGGWPMLAAEFS
jgi:hypothetical protein